jgi:hypothetical protein
MKFLTIPAILAAALFSAVVVVPFIAGPNAIATGRFALEVNMASTRPGFVQVYYRDASGTLSEAASSKLPLEQGSSPRRYRLPLPSGPLGDLRFDPVNRAGSVTIESVRIVARNGRVVRPVQFSEITAGQQIGSMEERDGRLEINTTPGGDDPQLTILPSPPIELNAGFFDRFEGFWPRSLSVFAVLAGLL